MMTPTTITKSFIFRFADVTVREREFAIVRAGQVHQVEPKAFQVLLALLRNPNKLISKEELLNWVWGNTAVTENSLARNIAVLRRLLGDDPRNPRYIETVTAVGYRFLCQATVSEEASEILETSRHVSANGIAGEFTAIPVAPNPEPAAGELGSRNPIQGVRRKLWKWLIPVVGSVLVIAVPVIWYLHRPLPPPRISKHSQVTHGLRLQWFCAADSSRLYLMAREVDSPILQVAIQGGDPLPVPVKVPAKIPWLFDASPDGSHFLVYDDRYTGAQDDLLWNISAVDGSYRLLGSAVDAAYAPDGKSVMYVTANHETWEVQGDGTGTRKLPPPGVEWPNMPVRSPDGKSYRFQKGSRIWEMSSDGSGSHDILPGWNTTGNGWMGMGKWTPDGRFFLFMAGGPQIEGGSQIFALDERKSLFRKPIPEPIQLTAGPMNWGHPIPGRDGKTIFAVGNTDRGELSRFDPATKALKPFLGGISAYHVSFSRDGRFVAYVAFPAGTLWKANRDGSDPVQLTFPPSDAVAPRWSRDGLQILFYDGRSGRNVAYTISSGGGAPRQIVPEDKGNQTDPNWSPDGKRIVFSDGRWNDPESELRIVDIDSHRVTPVPGSLGLWSPRWSPDGRFIVALTDDETSAMKVFDTQTQQWSTLCDGGVSYPAFSWDSRSVYFVHFNLSHKGPLSIHRVPVSGGKEEHFVDLGDWDFEQGAGAWLNLDPDDAPLLMRATGGAEVYALTLEEK